MTLGGSSPAQPQVATNISREQALSAVQPAIERKRLGAFYTPLDVAQIVSTWAIQSAEDLVLEPSFGGCGFLHAALDRLTELGCTHPAKQLFGCDIDRTAVGHLYTRLGPTDITRRFLLRDFLEVTPADFAAPTFDSVVGNPPYISHHNCSVEQKAVARNMSAASQYGVPRTASLWAYFVVHSLSFLKIGGRLGFVLPIAFLSSDYAAHIRRVVCERFSRVVVIALRSRVFAGTDERCVIVAASGFGGVPADDVELYDADSVDDLREILKRVSVASSCAGAARKRPDCFTLLESNAYRKIFGDLAKLRIGMVTGSNAHFVLDYETAKRCELLTDAVPIATKLRATDGLAFGLQQHREHLVRGDRCLLVAPSDGMQIHASPVRRYLARIPRALRRSNRTFRKRHPWYVVDDELVPDAFLSYMHQDGPRYAINTLRANCTNAIHRVYFHDHVLRSTHKLVAISLLSTFSELSAEYEGRTYGGGVLKHELRDAARISVLVPPVRSRDIDAAFRLVSALRRRGSNHEARQFADRFVLKAAGVSGRLQTSIVPVLSRELERCRERRQT